MLLLSSVPTLTASLILLVLLLSSVHSLTALLILLVQLLSSERTLTASLIFLVQLLSSEHTPTASLILLVQLLSAEHTLTASLILLAACCSLTAQAAAASLRWHFVCHWSDVLADVTHALEHQLLCWIAALADVTHVLEHQLLCWIAAHADVTSLLGQFRLCCCQWPVCFWLAVLAAEISSCGDTLSASYDVAAVQAYPAPFSALCWLSHLLFGFFVVSPACRAAACCLGGTPAAAVEGLAWMWKKEA